MTRRQRALVALAVAGLQACGGGGGGDPGTPGPGPSGTSALCQTVGGGAAQLEVTPGTPCSDCAVIAAAALIDGNLASGATVQSPLGGQLTLRGTAQSGVVFPAGRSAGVFVQPFGSDDDSSLSLIVRTYLSGALQDSGPVYTRVGSSDLANGTQVVTREGSYYGLLTTRPYDAVELELTRSGDGRDLTIFEICTR